MTIQYKKDTLNLQEDSFNSNKHYRNYVTNKEKIFKVLHCNTIYIDILKELNILCNKSDFDNKKLNQRRSLLFLLIFLTGVDLKILLEMRKINFLNLIKPKVNTEENIENNTEENTIFNVNYKYHEFI